MGNTGKYTFERSFFWYSFFFMMIRTFSSLLCASKVNESAKETETLIRLIPSAKWNSDLQRLNDTIKSNTIGLSGRRFFFVTKTFILAMIGTVVKYELVLLDEVNNYGGLPDVCHYLK
ncbi:gustatory receptor for sugar taste 64b-like [Chironomus tepperi]|uniref:gustatory receptor for sugar taste 64b-like n=1 Tax=Chironomus tepperi TaxID=113505 RepID=UPI00391F61A6